ncbi:MAG: bifunctional DNA-formamidopyrimidine glycosylase/DNA-(apurinic or apyrimidinic site) lyase [Acidimicrobiia bacterium]
MPEIAEVETFKTQLEKILVDKTIEHFNVYHNRAVRRQNIKEFISIVEKTKIIEIIRYGKYLSFHLDNSKYLNVHLRMSGRFLIFDKTTSIDNLPKHSHVVISTDEQLIVYIDPRTFGEFWLTDHLPSQIKNGVDAFLSKSSDLLEALTKMKNSSRPIKSILLDQEIIAGIGNIYSDEICSCAGIKPSRQMKKISEDEFNVLTKCISKVIKQAIKDRGSSLKDESFKDLHGQIGSYQNKHVVHARSNCKRCGLKVTKIKVSGRSTYFCDNCQN